MIDFILQPLADFIFYLVNKFGYWGIVSAMAIESACIPLPSEIIMPFSGFMVYKGIFDFWFTALAGGIGCTLGSVLAYGAGYFGGENFVRKFIKKYGKFFLVFEYELDEAEQWFRKYGELIAFSSRLMPVVRTFISLPAGISKMNFKRFCLYTFVGSFIWSTVLTYIGRELGENWQIISTYFHKFDLFFVSAGLGVVIWYIHHKIKKNRIRNS